MRAGRDFKGGLFIFLAIPFIHKGSAVGHAIDVCPFGWAYLVRIKAISGIRGATCKKG